MLKRMISLILCAVTVFSVLPIQALSTETDPLDLVTETEPFEETTAPTEAATEPTEKAAVSTEAVTEPLVQVISEDTEFMENLEPTEERTEQEKETFLAEQTENDPSLSESLPAASNSCGTNAYWSYNSDTKTLIIYCGEGSGAMDGYGSNSVRPWQSYQKVIEAIVIQPGIINIGHSAFSGCSSVKSISIPNTMTIIGDGAFLGCSNLGSISIPYGVREIGTGSFAECSSLTELFIPQTVTRIGAAAFRNCSNMESIILPDTLTTSFGVNMFAECSCLRSIVVPDGVTSIGNSAFYQCTSLESISIPESVTSVSQYAFMECKGLRSIVLPDAVTSIGEWAFALCSNLVRIDLSDDLLTIGKRAFSMCYQLNEIALPSGLTSIGDEAFYTCESLTDIIIPAGVSSIGTNTFIGCSSLTDVTILGDVAEIGNSAFSGCRNLKNLNLPDTVTRIGRYAFRDCTNLCIGKLPESLIELGEGAFEDCNALTDLVFPHGLTEIAANTFNGCINLKGPVIPENVTSIGAGAFWCCYALDGITFTGDAPMIASDAFYSVVATAYYPANNTSWTDDVMQHYSGNLTWVPRDDIGLEEITVVCHANEYEVEDNKESYLLCPGVKITVGKKTYETDEKGMAVIAGKKEDIVSFYKEGYGFRSIPMETLMVRCDVYLQKESEYPIINALWMDHIDILQEEKALDYTSEDIVVLIPDVNWEYADKKSLVLWQEGKEFVLNEGENVIALTSVFDITKEIYIVATNVNGKTTKKVLKITDVNLEGFTFNLGDGLKFTLPESAGILAGAEMGIDIFSPVAVEVVRDHGKIYAAIGFNFGKEADEKKEEVKSTAQSVKALCEKVRNIPDEIKKYKACNDEMKAFKGLLENYEGSWGTSAVFSIMGFAEGYMDRNNQFVLTASGGIMLFSTAADLSKNFMVGPVPLIFEFGFSGDFQNQMGLYLNREIKEFTPQLVMENEIALKLGLGVGLANVASVTGGGKGTLMNTARFNAGEIEYYKLAGTLAWYVKLRILFASSDWGDVFARKTFYEYPDPGSPAMTLRLDDEPVRVGKAKPDYYDGSQYTIDDLRYLSYGSSFMGGGTSTSSGRSLNNDVPFVSNAYEGADPQTVTFLDGTRLAVWIGYNDSHSGANALNLYYSYYNGVWSQPQVVEDDGTTDAYPDLKVINDTAYLVWQDASGSIGSSATLDSIANLMEISGAVFNRETERFVSSSITSGSGVLNLQPKLCGDSSAVYVVWHRNGENDWFGQNSSNSLLCSRFSGGGWGSSSVLYSGLNPLMSFDVSCSGGSCIVAYAMDGDGNLNTTGDLEVYKNGIALTDNDWLDSGVTFSGTDLYWYSGGRLLKNGDDIMPEGVLIGSDRFQIVNENGVHAVVYAEEDGLASVLKAAYYDASNGGWGAPKDVYNAGTSISAFSASATPDGELSVLIQSQEVTGEFDGTDPYGTVNLVWYHSPMGCNIRLDDVRFDNENYIPNNDMPVYLTVTNVGELAVQKLQIRLTDEDGTVVKTETVEQRILSGETKEIEFFYHVTSAEQGKNLRVSVIPVDMEDTVAEDNSGKMILGWADIAVEDIQAGVTEAGEIVIHANIVNRGYQPQSDVTVKLLEMTPSGAVAGTIVLESIDAQSRESVSFTLGDLVSKVYYVAVDHKEADQNYANDNDFVNVSAGIAPEDVYGENAVLIHETELGKNSIVCIDGVEQKLRKFDEYYYLNLNNGNGAVMTAYNHHIDDSEDVHTQYPVSMKVWTLSNADGIYTATCLEEFDDILQYSGASIRTTGKKGIRMITSMEQTKKNALTADGLAGYTLKEYGTVIAWAEQLGDQPLVLGASYAKSNYAYKKGVSDPVFNELDGLMQYTNVLVNFSDTQCSKDIAMRSYMILEDADGNEVTFYGGIVTRSIGYIAYQNRNTCVPGTESYEYIWDIIHTVYGDIYDDEYQA